MKLKMRMLQVVTCCDPHDCYHCEEPIASGDYMFTARMHDTDKDSTFVEARFWCVPCDLAQLERARDGS